MLAGYTARQATFPVLTFHRVNDENDPFFPSMPSEVFERQMSFVARTYVVLPVEELVDRMERGKLPRNSLAITFDDGYRDNLTHAAVILARYGLPATVFLATGAIGSPRGLWFDQLALAFKQTKRETWRVGDGEDVSLGTQAGRLRGLELAQGRLKRMTDGARSRALAEITESLGLGAPEYLDKLMLSWQDVHALRRLGMTIGAHTVNHPILSRLSLPDARFEIERSRSMIADACGAPPRAFAYPNGREEDYTEAVVEMVRDAGFTCAVTTRFGVNTARTPRYELRRGGPWERDLPTFALKQAAYRLTQA